ncbi:MAG: S41 family peptidase [Mucilaginibacter sp.]|uniref:S41 family peptidase n=1 Tax=Mucilaginibacter sp. TaxID=1882438 RepID=UPI0031AAD596
MRKLFYLILIFSVGGVAACKKDKGPGNNSPTDSATTKLQISQDSIYYYAKEIYYWNSFLPDYKTFNPRQYTNGSTDIDKLTAEIDAYTQLSKNPLNGNRPYEYDDFNPGSSKYSFIDDGTTNTELNASKGDYGFNYFYNTVDDIRVSLVYAGSPAAKAGLTRGDQIIAVNGSTAINITNSNDPVNDAGYKFVYNAVNNTSTVALQVKKLSGGTVTVNLNAQNYTLNPLIYSNTYSLTGGKVAGYFVFNNFTSPEVAQPKLDSVFSAFAAKGVTDLIVDLRYNGGGDVRTSTYLSNLIVPASASGSVMNTTYWTANLQNDNYPNLKKNLGDFGPGYFKPTNAAQIEKFAKAGGLNVSRVFFLVTGNTASASELTINNLRPKMDVQMIGQPTYGKPVGFLSNLIIKGQYFYTPEFEIKNSANEGGYYLGMEPGGPTPNGGIYTGKLDDDDLTRAFGDQNEGLLNDALTYIKTNAYPQNTGKQTVQSLSTGRTMTSVQRNTLSVKTNSHRLHGMYISIKGKK